MKKVGSAVRAWHFQTRKALQTKNLGDYWEIFFALQYICFCCPFRIVQARQASRSYKVVNWLPQKLLCLCFQILNLVIWIPYYFRKRIPSNLHSASEYLFLVSEINLAIFRISIWKLYWFHQSDILKIVNFSCNTNNFKIGISKTQLHTVVGKRLFIVLLVTLPSITLLQWIYELLLRNPNQSWMIPVFNRGREAFFMEYFVSKLTQNQSISAAQSIFTVVTSASHIGQYLFYTSRLNVIFLQVLTLWSLICTFIECLNVNFNNESVLLTQLDSFNLSQPQQISIVKPQRVRQLLWSTIKEELMLLKRLATMINSTFGLTFASFIVDTMFYYSGRVSAHIFKSVTSTGIYQVLRWIYLLANFSSTIVIIVLAADICTRV